MFLSPINLDCWNFVINVGSLDFNSLEPWKKLYSESKFLLSILEVCDVFDVLLLSWVVPGLLQSLESVQVVLIAVLGDETVLSWNIVTLNEFFVDGLASDASV